MSTSKYRHRRTGTVKPLWEYSTWSQSAGRLDAFLDTQTLKKNTSRHPNLLCGFSKNLKLKLIIEFLHLLIIPMTLFNNIMPYFDEFIHVYG